VNLLIKICWEEICITYGISVTWVVTMGRGRRAKFEDGYWERMSQVRKIGKMLLNGGFQFFVCLYITQIIV